MPLYAGILEIVIVRPDRQFQLEREGQHVYVVGVAGTNAAAGFGHLILVLSRVNNPDGKRGHDQNGIFAMLLLMPPLSELRLGSTRGRL